VSFLENLLIVPSLAPPFLILLISMIYERCNVNYLQEISVFYAFYTLRYLSINLLIQ
jgi:hypothetical protein